MSRAFFELQTAGSMLEKAKRELTRLETEDSIDHVYNFFVTAYHIVDYLKDKDRFPKLDVKVILDEPMIRSFWQADNPNPKAVCVLPVPDGPSAMQFWRLLIHSQRISSRTSALFSDGWAAMPIASS